MKSKRMVLATAVLALSAPTTQALAADNDWQIGVRTGILLSGGKPANDITYSGLSAKYRWRENEHVGVSIDRLSFDYERPWQTLGLVQDKTVKPKDIDAKTDSTLFRLFYERDYGTPEQSWNPYWNAGIGFASVDVKTATGPVVGGGTFNITTDGGTEIVLSVGGGFRYNFTRQFAADLGAGYNYHRADWKVRDSVSGRTGTLSGYSTYGVQLGVTYRF